MAFSLIEYPMKIILFYFELLIVQLDILWFASFFQRFFSWSNSAWSFELPRPATTMSSATFTHPVKSCRASMSFLWNISLDTFKSSGSLVYQTLAKKVIIVSLLDSLSCLTYQYASFMSNFFLNFEKTFASCSSGSIKSGQLEVFSLEGLI